MAQAALRNSCLSLEVLMSKIGLLVLVVAAFLYAGWLVVMKKNLPDSRLATGLKKRFLLATFLFVGMLALSCRCRGICREI